MDNVILRVDPRGSLYLSHVTLIFGLDVVADEMFNVVLAARCSVAWFSNDSQEFFSTTEEDSSLRWFCVSKVLRAASALTPPVSQSWNTGMYRISSIALTLLAIGRYGLGQTSDVTCLAEFDWVSNHLFTDTRVAQIHLKTLNTNQETPCRVAAALEGICPGGQYATRVNHPKPCSIRVHQVLRRLKLIQYPLEPITLDLRLKKQMNASAALLHTLCSVLVESARAATLRTGSPGALIAQPWTSQCTPRDS